MDAAIPLVHARTDYSLVGPGADMAVAAGLVSAEWYRTPIPRKDLKALMQRKDGPALRDTALWFLGLAVFGALAFHFWGTWWCVPFFLLYGVLYGSASDSRWHECGHGTAFKTPWMNDVVYNIACFMIMREPTVWRWSHTKHHTDTIIVGSDPEIVLMRPPDMVKLLFGVVGLTNAYYYFQKLVRHAGGALDDEEMTFVPETERPRVYTTARIFLALYAAIVVACFVTGSILPAMFTILATFYGAPLHVYFGVTQHVGLAEDTLDHRLNSRTVMMNPFFRFVYWNMNYHVEHHMFPMVPYHALPELHEAMKADCPTPYPSTIAAYREILPTLLRQLRDPTYFVRRQLPAGAKS